MSERADYGEDYLVEVPLIDGGGTAFLTAAPTIAAGDVKIRPDTVMVSGVREGGLHVNPDAYILGFDSLSEIPDAGDTLSENGGDGSAVVMFTIFDGGTNLATGDMSGFFIVKSVSGTWTDNATIDISGGTVNVATVDATNHDIAATAGLFAFANNRAYFGITAEEMTCKTMAWEIKDATATEEWEDTAGIIETEGHPAAKYPNGARFAGIIGDPVNDFVSATSVNIPQSGHADAHDWFDDASVIPPATDDRINNLTIKFWDADDPDLFEIAQIEDWDADGGGVNEGQITLKGRGLVREPALDGATTVRYIIYEDYDVVTERIATGETGAGLTAQPWNADWDAEVQSEVTDALVAHNLDHVALTGTTTPVPVGTYLGRVMHSSTAGTFDRTTDSLEAIRNTAPLGTAMRGTDSAFLAASAPTNFGNLAITTAGIVSTSLNNPLTAAQVNAEVDTALVDANLDHLALTATTTLPGSKTYLGYIMHKSTAGTYSRAADSLEAIRDRGDVGWTGGTTLSAAAVADAVWDEAIAGHVGAGSFGAEVQAHALSSELPTNLGNMAITTGGAVTVGTNNDKTGYALTQSFPTNFASLSVTTGGAVTAGTVSDKTGYSLAATGLDAVTIAEPSARPEWGTVTARTALGHLLAPIRNKVIQNSTSYRVRNDADSANIVDRAVTATTTTVTIAEPST